eukprot:1381704-Pyramimonas_sp.AAC.1
MAVSWAASSARQALALGGCALVAGLSAPLAAGASPPGVSEVGSGSSGSSDLARALAIHF